MLIKVRIEFEPNLVKRIRAVVGVQDLLLGLLGNGQLFRNSISGAGGGIDDVLHALVEHGVQKIQSVHNIIAEIFARLPYRLSHIGGSGKVDHGLDAMLLKRALNGGLIGQVGFHQKP